MEINFNQEQLAVIEATEPKVLVEAAAGSGKSAVLVERFKREVINGTEPSKMVAITFTNNAASEMVERLGDYARGAFIGTIHSYMNYLLKCHNIDTRDYLEKENFDALFTLVKKYPDCIQEVEYLSCDETQDQTAEQYDVILKYIKPHRWFMVADPRQEIFAWAGASTEHFFALKHDPTVKVYYLRSNYRCGTKILDYAKGIIHLAGDEYDDDSIAVSGRLGKVIDVEYNADALCQGIRTWSEKNNEPWSDWLVLCRTNEEIDYFCQALRQSGIPCDTFKRKDLTRDALNKRLNENTVKVLTIHAAKGLEAKNVAVIGARFYNTEEKCVAYVAATRAKELLIWARTPRGKKKYYNNYRINVRSWE